MGASNLRNFIKNSLFLDKNHHKDHHFFSHVNRR